MCSTCPAFLHQFNHSADNSPRGLGFSMCLPCPKGKNVLSPAMKGGGRGTRLRLPSDGLGLGRGEPSNGPTLCLRLSLGRGQILVLEEEFILGVQRPPGLRSFLPPRPPRGAQLALPLWLWAGGGHSGGWPLAPRGWPWATYLSRTRMPTGRRGGYVGGRQTRGPSPSPLSVPLLQNELPKAQL